MSRFPWVMLAQGCYYTEEFPNTSFLLIVIGCVQWLFFSEGGEIQFINSFYCLHICISVAPSVNGKKVCTEEVTFFFIPLSQVLVQLLVVLNTETDREHHLFFSSSLYVATFFVPAHREHNGIFLIYSCYMELKSDRSIICNFFHLFIIPQFHHSVCYSHEVSLTF